MSLLELVEQAVPGPLTDAVEHARAGRGASALVAAENRMLALLDGLDDDEPFTIDVAWALSQHAEVLHRFGDPDLAVAAADLALRTFLNRGDEINRMLVAKASYVRAFIAAALIAADIHERFGRADIAESARSMAADAVAGSPGITIDPALPLLADMSLARALDRVRTPVAGRSREAGEAVGRIKGSVIAPATDCSLILTSGRCSELNPVLVAQLLAVGTEAVIADDPVAGLRLGLEAHVLYASLSQAQTSEMRYDFATHGPHWARTLLLCSRAAAQHDLRDLALDLAAWMGGAAEGLAPFVVIDTETRSLARDCLAWHAEILESSGEIDGANRAAQALRALEEMP